MGQMVKEVESVESVEKVGIIFRRPHDKNCHFLYLIVIIDFLNFEVKKVCVSIISLGYINWKRPE